MNCKIQVTFILLSFNFVQFALAQNGKNVEDLCYDYDKGCSLCIRQPNCKWCSKSRSGSLEHNCFSSSKNLSSFCLQIEDPPNSDVTLLRNDDLTEIYHRTNLNDELIVELKPQHIKLKLRRGVPINITLTYRQVKDYPLDLYYLMDLSKSMLPDKETLAELGNKLAVTMRTLTTQFRLGFGSFVDKKMSPFVNVHPIGLDQPCSDVQCATPFSFRNNLPLNEDAEHFTKQVRNARISTNQDNPEGGFDALMQAMVCKDEIGWKDNVRKIIVLSTDAPFHFAGDGKMLGIIKPNDMKCHLDKDGFYTMYAEQDYPSIGQIDEVAQEKGINLIFAFKKRENTIKLYKDLSERIKGSAYGELTSESRNVVELVKKIYSSITDKIEIEEKSTIPDSPISIRYFTNCGDHQEIETNVCNNVTEGKTFDYKIELKANECPKDGSRIKTIEIGTLQEKLRIDIEFLCDCLCDQENHEDYEVNSPDCSYKGTKQCEVCQCNPGYYGKRCHCSRGEVTSDTNLRGDLNKCRPKGANSSVPVCSGKGSCECEECKCWNENFSGTFCHCNRASCRYEADRGFSCSGNGDCKCNQCECKPGWTGTFCECPDNQACVPKDGGGSCNDNGDCKCGQCQCKEKYTGEFCEECPTCGEGKCEEFRPCVYCSVSKSDVIDEGICPNCSDLNIQVLDSLEGPLNEWARLCPFTDDNDGCRYNFTYKYINTEKRYAIYAQRRRTCPEKVEIVGVFVGVAIGIVAIGVLTLVIWKLLTSIHDRREFEKFETESKNPVWTTENNPLYKGATTTVANPGFAANDYK